MDEIDFWAPFLALRADDITHLNHNKVFTVDSNSTALEAFRVLAMNSIVSAPVYDSETDEYCGFIDYCDLTRYIVNIFSNEFIESNNTIPNETIFSLLNSHTVDVHVQHCRWIVVRVDTPIQEVLMVLKDQNTVAMVDDDGQILKIIARIDIINTLVFLHGLIGQTDLFEVPLSELGCEKQLYMCNWDDRFLKVLRDFYKLQVSCAIIRDRHGQYLTNVSRSDLKGLLLDIHALDKNVLDVIASVRQTDTLTYAPLIRLDEASSLREVMVCLHTTKKHHCWIFREKQPIGVISVGDLVSWFCQLFEDIK
ncbi:hypothetical protein PCE1_001153 [Barthelona sp. PCE]